MQEKNIEVEIKAFITKEQYEKLLEFFKENAELVKEDFQETQYFDCNNDVRIQKNNFGSKIVLKEGIVHDEQREELEVETKKEDFEKLEKIFSSAGLGVEIRWLRDRKQFLWDKIDVCLDYPKGYGYIIELEKMSDKNNKDETLKILKDKLSELNITLTPREEFERKFNDYKKNWEILIENAMD